jgi:hypothetical protein
MERRTEDEALYYVTLHGLKQFQLVIVFNTFSHDSYIKAVGKLYY